MAGRSTEEKLVARFRHKGSTDGKIEVIIGKLDVEKKWKLLEYLKSLNLAPNVESSCGQDVIVSMDISAAESKIICKKIVVFMESISVDNFSISSAPYDDTRPEIEESDDEEGLVADCRQGVGKEENGGPERAVMSGEESEFELIVSSPDDLEPGEGRQHDWQRSKATIRVLLEKKANCQEVSEPSDEITDTAELGQITLQVPRADEAAVRSTSVKKCKWWPIKVARILAFLHLKKQKTHGNMGSAQRNSVGKKKTINHLFKGKSPLMYNLYEPYEQSGKHITYKTMNVEELQEHLERISQDASSFPNDKISKKQKCEQLSVDCSTSEGKSKWLNVTTKSANLKENCTIEISTGTQTNTRQDAKYFQLKNNICKNCSGDNSEKICLFNTKEKYEIAQTSNLTDGVDNFPTILRNLLANPEMHDSSGYACHQYNSLYSNDLWDITKNGKEDNHRKRSLLDTSFTTERSTKRDCNNSKTNKENVCRQIKKNSNNHNFETSAKPPILYNTFSSTLPNKSILKKRKNLAVTGDHDGEKGKGILQNKRSLNNVKTGTKEEGTITNFRILLVKEELGSIYEKLDLIANKQNRTQKNAGAIDCFSLDFYEIPPINTVDKGVNCTKLVNKPAGIAQKSNACSESKIPRSVHSILKNHKISSKSATPQINVEHPKQGLVWLKLPNGQIQGFNQDIALWAQAHAIDIQFLDTQNVVNENKLKTYHHKFGYGFKQKKKTLKAYLIEQKQQLKEIKMLLTSINDGIKSSLLQNVDQKTEGTQLSIIKAANVKKTVTFRTPLTD